MQHELNIVLFGLPASATVQIDLPREARASMTMLPWTPFVLLGRAYGGFSTRLRSLSIQPRRLRFELEGAPPELPITLQIASDERFIFGWLQVPDHVECAVWTAQQRMRVVGSTYWALPLPFGDDGSHPAEAVAPSLRRAAAAQAPARERTGRRPRVGATGEDKKA